MISSVTGTEAVVILGKGSVSSLREYSVYLSTLMATLDCDWICAVASKRKTNQKRVSVLMMLKSIIITQKLCNMYEKQPTITPFFYGLWVSMQANFSCHSLASALLAAALSGINTTELLIGSPT